MTTAIVRRVPAIGETFAYDEGRYRVTAWLCRASRAPIWARDLGPDRCKLRFCLREEAEYVSGAGVCGVVCRVSDVKVDGMVPWPADLLFDATQHAVWLAGQSVD
jgi:hypothetical protein